MMLQQMTVKRNGAGDLVITMPIEYGQELVDMVEDAEPADYGDKARDYAAIRTFFLARMREADPTRVWIS